MCKECDKQCEECDNLDNKVGSDLDRIGDKLGVYRECLFLSQEDDWKYRYRIKAKQQEVKRTTSNYSYVNENYMYPYCTPSGEV